MSQSKTNFTPGPWELDDLDIFDAKGNQIASVYNSAKLPAGINCGPDAALIAAAPELYEKLEECYKWFANFQYESGDGMLITGEILELLAKARGES